VHPLSSNHTAMRRPLSLIAFLALASIAQAQAGGNQLVQRLDSMAGSGVVEGRAVGLAVAVVKGNDTLLMKGYGLADLEAKVPTPADAVYEIGSVTKQFTAAAILQLRDAGKLSLDDDVTKWLPDFPTHGNKLPLKRLLDHTSGIKGLTEMPEFRALSQSTFPRDSAYALIKRYPYEFAPGEAMIYNNSAFWLLGLIVEKASGMSYEDYIEKRIFAPLGMTRSSYCHSEETVDRKALGHAIQNGTPRRTPPNNHTWPFSAGSLCSTAGDMVTWLKALHGGKVLSPKSYAEMTTPSKLNDGTPLRYNMGLALGVDARGLKRIGHGGAITGYVSEANWYPDAQLAVVVLMNSAGGINPAAIASELAGEILPWTRPTQKAFTGDATALAGTYKGPSRGREAVVVVAADSARGVTLSLNGSQPRPLSWEEGWRFRAGPNDYVTFERRGSSDGLATILKFDAGGGLYVLKRQ
jgi:CubicO group peptidase (beta-lactamase class C family)